MVRKIGFTRQMFLLQVGLIFVVVAVGFGLVGWLLNGIETSQFEQRALSVARSVASISGLGDQARAEDPRHVIADTALRASRATGALFVVVTDRNGVRLAHPNPAAIGQRVSTDPSAAFAGRETVSVDRGTLGLSVRGKVPLRDSAGSIVGEVSVGFDASQIRSGLIRLLRIAALFMGAALALGVVGSLSLVRVLKRKTLGLEPADLAELVREREAVLRGVSDGVLAVDPTGTVSMANEEVGRLLGSRIQPGTHVRELELPPGLRNALAEQAIDNVMVVTGEHVIVANHRRVHLDGRDLGGVLTLRDRTQLEALTNELGAVRGLTDALRAQSHEFANRLHTLGGLLQMGRHADAIDYLMMLQAAPRIDAEDADAPVQDPMLRAFLAAKVVTAKEAGVRLAVAEDSWVPLRVAKPLQVITVIGNLVDNAVAAARASGERPAQVDVTLLFDQAQLVVSVANTGDGVPEEQAAEIFIEGVSSNGPGRGLGLAIARGTARALGGDLRVTSLGGGGTSTVFVAWLPGVFEGGIDNPETAHQQHEIRT